MGSPRSPWKGPSRTLTLVRLGSRGERETDGRASEKWVREDGTGKGDLLPWAADPNLVQSPAGGRLPAYRQAVVLSLGAVQGPRSPDLGSARRIPEFVNTWLVGV